MNKRLNFMDRLRTLAILLVVVLHSAVNYSEAAGFWYYKGTFIGPALDLWLYILDIILMPLLFFIAGFFTYRSYCTKSKTSFFRSKVKKLLIPWLIITLIILPNLDFIAYQFNDLGELNYIHYITMSWKSIFTPKLGYLSMDSFVPLTQQFYQRYMWFLTLLYFIYLIYPFINRAVNKKGNLNIIRHFLFTIIAFFVVFGLIKTGLNWFSFFNILQFQPAKVVLYLSLFILGDKSFKASKFIDDGLTTKNWYNLVAFILFFISSFVLSIIISKAETITNLLRLLFSITYTGVSFFSIIYFVNLGFKTWNREKSIFNRISGLSFDIYLVHYIWVMLIPILLHNSNITPVLKFLIVAVTSICMSILSSKIIKKIKA